MSRPLTTDRTIRVDNTLPAAISASISASSACCSLPRRPVRADAATPTTNPEPHCNPVRRPAASVLGRSAPLPYLAASECNPRLVDLNRCLPLLPRCRWRTASNARAPRFWVSWAGRCSRTQDRRSDDANDCAAPTLNPWAAATTSKAALRAVRSSLLRRGSCRAACHAGSALTARLRPMNPSSTALYTRAPVKNRVPITRHWPGSGRSGHDRTCVAAPFGRLRARGLRSPDCPGSAAGLGAMRQALPTPQP